jgi:AcrR family transcriptional regulator
MPRGPALSSARRAIVDAALELFSSRGYEATTIEDIRAASGASTGSIYHHFGNKEGLAAAIFVEGLADFQEQLIALYETEADAEVGVRAVVRLYLSWAAKNQSLARFLLTARPPEVRVAATPELEALNQRFFAASAQWQRAQIEAGRLRPVPPDAFRAIVIGPAEAFARRWLARRTKLSIAAATDELAEAAWRALRPDR